MTAGPRRGPASLARRTRPRPEPTPADRAAPGVCAACGHHLSAWVGGSCTVMLPNGAAEVAAGAALVRSCGCDCSVGVLGESAWERLRRALTEPATHDGHANSQEGTS